MSTIHNYTHASSHRLLGTLLNLTHLFLLIALAGGLILVAPASAQSNEAPNTKTGSILGTVFGPRSTYKLGEKIRTIHLSHKNFAGPQRNPVYPLRAVPPSRRGHGHLQFFSMGTAQVRIN